jgi:hypothetical protein
VRTHRVVVASPVLDENLNLLERIEDPLIEQFVPE